MATLVQIDASYWVDALSFLAMVACLAFRLGNTAAQAADTNNVWMMNHRSASEDKGS